MRMLSSEHCLDCSTSDLFPKKKTETAWRKGERKVGEGERPSCMPWGYTLRAGRPTQQHLFPIKACGLASYHLGKQKYRF